MEKLNLTPEQRENIDERVAALAALNIYRERRRLEQQQRRHATSDRQRQESQDSPELELDLTPAILRSVTELHLSADQKAVVAERIASLVSISVYRDLQRVRNTVVPSGTPGTIVGNCSSSSCRDDDR